MQVVAPDFALAKVETRVDVDLAEILSRKL